jgi:heme exporter protein CcmD
VQGLLDHLGKNSGFILASYGVAVLIMSGLVWHSLARYADAKRRFTERLGADNG